jgi:hypothetical protein
MMNSIGCGRKRRRRFHGLIFKTLFQRFPGGTELNHQNLRIAVLRSEI